MSRKIAVVGGRDYNDYISLSFILDSQINDAIGTEIVSGGCRGTDMLAAQYAKTHSLKLTEFKPDWSIGLSAGPIRNKLIVEYCDEVIAFWDGKSAGTKSTINLAKQFNKPLIIVKY